MTRQVSLGTMIEQLDGLRDTRDLTDWEQQFVTHVLHRYLTAGKSTATLSGKQVEKIAQIYGKHFS